MLNKTLLLSILKKKLQDRKTNIRIFYQISKSDAQYTKSLLICVLWSLNRIVIFCTEIFFNLLKALYLNQFEKSATDITAFYTPFCLSRPEN
jgi:hypothetical protein